MNRAELLNDAETALRLALDGRQAMTWTALPGLVTAVNLSAMTCSVQPTITSTIQDENGAEQSVNLPLLVDVPIVFPKAGGFTITFPIVAGDEVLVVFSSRCIDAWWQSGGVQQPMEARMHDLSDGFAILAPSSQPNVISGISSNALQIRNDDGDTYLEVATSGKVKLVATNKITIKNSSKNLLAVLDGMLDLLNTLNSNLSTFSATVATDPIALVTAGAAATLAPQLTALIAQVTAYKTAQIGALLE